MILFKIFVIFLIIFVVGGEGRVTGSACHGGGRGGRRGRTTTTTTTTSTSTASTTTTRSGSNFGENVIDARVGSPTQPPAASLRFSG
ncbi:unnamed protein product [Chironomus riparius]|uniref:Uncharacterized protein n=1 Tax=Chironomus riparius TaxID=315576 RepID=A0A9N9S658_9DIPT|nr:unnamed protein product [Chironomus riparius]